MWQSVTDTLRYVIAAQTPKELRKQQLLMKRKTYHFREVYAEQHPFGFLKKEIDAIRDLLMLLWYVQKQDRPAAQEDSKTTTLNYVDCTTTIWLRYPTIRQHLSKLLRYSSSSLVGPTGTRNVHVMREGADRSHAGA